MAKFQFLLVLFSFVCVNAYLLSDLTDYRDYDVDCVAGYLQHQQPFNSITFKPKQRRLNYCRSYIDQLQKSFYDSVETSVASSPQKNCVINLLQRHNVGDVFVKAIGYNYFKRQLVRFASNETCDGVVNVLRVDNDCEQRVMSAKFIGGAWKLQSCLDDLFGEFKIDEIYFPHENYRIGARKFGRHLSEFISQLGKTGKAFCSEDDVTLAIKYFDVKKLLRDESKEIYNQTQIECFKMYFINHGIVRSSAYRFYDTIILEDDSQRCDEIMRELVERVITIDLFGFTELSQRVKDCVVTGNSVERIIEQAVILPAVVRFIDIDVDDFSTPMDIFIGNMKKIIELTLNCLKQF